MNTKTHRRFYIEPNQIDGTNIILNAEQTNRITKVLRLKAGDESYFFDGHGNVYSTILDNISRQSSIASIISSEKYINTPSFKLTLVMSIPKGDKMDLIVQKCTELGISEIVITATERSVSSLDESRINEKLTRWKKISIEAVEQCGRSDIPLIRYAKFDDVVCCAVNYKLRLAAWEDEREIFLREILRKYNKSENAIIFIGPEGGFTNKEILFMKSESIESISLGRRVLRSETAAIAACTTIMYELES